MKKAIIFILIAFAGWTLIFKPSPHTALLVGTNAEFPPFTFRQEGEIVGFDIDIAKEVSRRLGKEMQFKDMPFDTLLPDLLLGQIDFIAAGMTATEERAKRVAFTKPYLHDDPLLIVTLDKPLKFEDLKGKTVVVNEGFTADIYLAKQNEVNLVRLPTTADGFIALKSGRADAFVTADSTVRSFYAAQGDAHFALESIPGTAENCALVLPKNNPDLLKQIQSALDEMEKVGYIDQLKKKWKLL